jgi:hypothetical protein
VESGTFLVAIGRYVKKCYLPGDELKQGFVSAPSTELRIYSIHHSLFFNFVLTIFFASLVPSHLKICSCVDQFSLFWLRCQRRNDFNAHVENAVQSRKLQQHETESTPKKKGTLITILSRKKNRRDGVTLQHTICVCFWRLVVQEWHINIYASPPTSSFRPLSLKPSRAFTQSRSITPSCSISVTSLSSLP